jgi:hypothetical protein
MKTYRLINTYGNVIRCGLTATEAANEILTYGGRSYEIRLIGGVRKLFVSHFSGEMVPARLNNRALAISRAKTEEAAWEDIAKQVIAAQWYGRPVAVPDKDCLNSTEPVT